VQQRCVVGESQLLCILSWEFVCPRALTMTAQNQVKRPAASSGGLFSWIGNYGSNVRR
jgi:hypothetical protein